MTDQLRGVMIGAGYFAGYHADAWNRMGSARITAVADIDYEKAEQLAARYLIPEAYDDPGKMIEAESPDFVDIITPLETHCDLVRLAADRRVTIICQKPIATSWEESLALVDSCNRAGVRLLVHENWRWQPWYRELKRLIDRQRFGQVFQLGFRLRSGDGRGAEPYTNQPYLRLMDRFLVQDTLVHLLDTFRFLGGEIDWVFCTTQTVNPRIRGEDSAIIVLRLAAGQRGLIDANRISGPVPPAKTFGTFYIEGDTAAARVNADGDIWMTDHGAEETKHPFVKPESGYRGDSVLAMQQHAIECLRSGRKAESEASEYHVNDVRGFRLLRVGFHRTSRKACGLPGKEGLTGHQTRK